jgi:transcriptional regulator with GAF, ATPase, and Fis domain
MDVGPDAGSLTLSPGLACKALTSRRSPTTKDAQVEERMLTTEVVLAAIKRANGNLTQAARILELTRSKLRRIMKKLGIKIEGE